MVKFFYSLALLLIAMNGGCARQSYLLSADGVKLGYEEKIIPSASKTVLFIHGLGENYDSFHYLRKDLSKAGWSTLSIDLRGHGSSKDWKGREIDWATMSEVGRQTAIEDVITAVDHLKEKENSSVWIVGSSFGANLALQYAVQDPSIKGIVLLSPGFNYSGIKAEDLMPHYGDRPIFLAGSQDDPGTLKICERLKILAQGDVFLTPRQQAGHGTEMITTDESLRKEIVEWMTKKEV